MTWHTKDSFLFVDRCILSALTRPRGLDQVPSLCSSTIKAAPAPVISAPSTDNYEPREIIREMQNSPHISHSYPAKQFNVTAVPDRKSVNMYASKAVKALKQLSTMPTFSARLNAASFGPFAPKWRVPSFRCGWEKANCAVMGPVSQMYHVGGKKRIVRNSTGWNLKGRVSKAVERHANS